MQLITLPIFHGTEKKKVTIFTFDVSSRSELCTGGADGEIHIYKLHEITKLPQIIKKHTGAVLTVRFDPTGVFLASASDDKTVVIYQMDNTGKYQYLLRLNDHNSDISSLAFTREVLITAGYDKMINIYNVSDFKLRKNLKKNSTIKGIIANPQKKLFCVQSEISLEIISYDGVTLHSNSINSIGLNMEGFFSRMSYSPDYKYLLAGLSFNEKQICVGVFDDTLNMKYSLMGHVAPSEAVAFHQSKHYIMAVGSQDRSISFWLSEKATPFLLLKNVVSSPIMDIKWYGNDLIFCSYEGQVKICSFGASELGDMTRKMGAEFPLTLKYFELGKVDLDETSCESGADKTRNEDENITTVINNSPPKTAPLVRASNDIPCSKEVIDEKVVNETTEKGKKRIKPILIEGSAVSDNRLIPITPFVRKIGDIELNFDLNKLVITRKNMPFHIIEDIPLRQICINKYYICLYYKKYIEILDIETNTPVLPIIYVGNQLIKIDLMGHNFLTYDEKWNLKVLDLNKKRCVVEVIAIFAEICLSKKYFLIGENKDEKFFYEKNTKCWYLLNNQVDSIYSKDIKLSDNDQTFEHIFYEFTVANEVKDIKVMRSSGKKLCLLLPKQINDEKEEKARWLVEKMVRVGCKNVVRKWLARMCRFSEMHCFIYDMNRLIRDLEIRLGF